MESEFERNRSGWPLWWLLAVACTGCASTRLTDTSRSGMEQLLVSTAIDSSLDKIDFESVARARVFVDEKLLDCTDKKYVLGAVRQRAFQAGCQLVEKADDADVILELYSGAVGTDRSEGFIGTPAFSLPGPMPLQLPELKLLSQTSQYGTAKIGVVAYDAKTRQALSSGALSRARSENSNWTILGFVPYSSGNMRDEVALTRRRRATDNPVLLSTRPLGPRADQITTQPPAYSSAPARFLQTSVPTHFSPDSNIQPTIPDGRMPRTEPWGPMEAHRNPNTQTLIQ